MLLDQFNWRLRLVPLFCATLILVHLVKAENQSNLPVDNPAIRSGDSFFRYANGRWLDTFEIPADKSSYGSSTQVSDIAEQRIRELIEGAVSQSQSRYTAAQRIGAFYAAFVDLPAIEARGLEPLRQQLEQIARAVTPRDFAGTATLRVSTDLSTEWNGESRRRR